MDAKALQEAAIEETARALLEKHGSLPDQDSEEWEAEYRRQFQRLKRGAASAAPPPTAAAVPVALPELRGAPAQKRWAAAIRAERLNAVPDRDMRQWLAGAWVSARTWIEIRDQPAPAFLRRVAAEFAAARRSSGEHAAAHAAERQAKEAASAAHAQKLRDAGITAEGLIGLIDVSPRVEPAPIAAKLAEVSAERRTLRVFETADTAVLLVLEKNDRNRSEYAIERDDGLVEDLKLFSSAALA